VTEQNPGNASPDLPDLPGLPATSWAVLGLLSFGEELSGYDVKKWADRSLSSFYWSPSFSQIYSELKRLEREGLATSRKVALETGNRDKRIYAITGTGMDAVTRWAQEAPVDPPVLKHGPMLRLWLGHLLPPERMREILVQHREFAERQRVRALEDAGESESHPEWTYPHMVLEWSAMRYEAERDLADRMLADLDKHAARYRPRPDC
jgi:DNA-binding PadR family transcriptional regulator